MQSNIDIDMIGHENYERVARMYDQFRLQNLKTFSSNSSSRNSTGKSIQVSETCKKTITIVFWDISGFSKLSKSFYLIDSENIILEFLEEYYKIASCIIAHNNGVWDKTIGDGIMSWFGFFEKNPGERTIGMDDGALDAINAAIELRSSFLNLKNKVISDWKIDGINPDFNIKCGINTGQAHIGLFYDQFTALGTNVNIASRLQEYAKGDQIIISNTTMEKVYSKGFDFRRISVDSNNPIKSFEDIDCCYEILF
jgi:class 3 adenylate cyclase